MEDDGKMTIRLLYTIIIIILIFMITVAHFILPTVRSGNSFFKGVVLSCSPLNVTCHVTIQLKRHLQTVPCIVSYNNSWFANLYINPMI